MDRAEDAVQDAYALALERWERDGPPAHPTAWIVAAARNRAIDRLRRERVGRVKEEAYAHEVERTTAALDELAAVGEDAAIPDERLELIFAWCHPALAMSAQVPLTLRLVGGLGVAEIARALLIEETTVAQRLVRAKRKLRGAGIPLALPAPERLDERLGAVLTTIYLIFNEGYDSAAGLALRRDDLAAEAIRLGRIVSRLAPDAAEPRGLLALMLLHHARRTARADADGRIVLLEDQDRALWDAGAIVEGRALTERALRTGQRAGPFALQAAIAAVHSESRGPADTDWAQIAALYDRLVRVTRSPVVALNRAAAVAMSAGPETGLALIDALAGRLDGYHLLHAARADLLRRLGRDDDAAAGYERALALVGNAAERPFLEERLAQARGRVGGAPAG